MIHLILAKKNDCYFVTRDKLDGKIQKIKNEYYEKIVVLKDIIEDFQEKNEKMPKRKMKLDSKQLGK